VLKIDAPALAEHQSRRRAAVVSAGTALLADRGVDSLTLAAVGAAAGLARWSVYQYSGSAPELLAAVVEDAFPRAIAGLQQVVDQAPSTAAQVEAFVETALQMATEPAHRSHCALGRLSLPAACQHRLAELHDQLNAPLCSALEALPSGDQALTTRLVLRVIGAGVQAVGDGAELDDVVGAIQVRCITA
jgi:AcrR family transcriptional regulator